MTELDNLIKKSRLNFTTDEMIGYLIHTEDWKFQLREDFDTHFIPADYCKDQLNIVIILESPHQHEFENVDLILKNTEVKVTSRPLNNQSTRRKLIDLLNGVYKDYLVQKKILDPKFHYNIILINSVQFQCSLGEETKIHRDKLFIWNWIDLKADFIERLRVLKPVYFINCCTKGTSSESAYLTEAKLKTYGLVVVNNDQYLFDVKKYFGKESFTLQDMVERELEINTLITNSNYFKYNHPSSRFEDGYPLIIQKNKINFSTKLFQIGTSKKQ